jgi:quercetin dioxygenase-like cupin family protein
MIGMAGRLVESDYDGRSMDASILGPGEGERIPVGPGVAILKATSETTGGAYALGETIVPPGFPGPPPHFHREHHYAFYVLEGRLTVLVGDEVREEGAGAFVCIPPGVVHTFSNKSAAPVRFLNVSTPGGMEDYLRELAAAIGDGAPDPKRMAEVMVKYDIVLADSPER